MTRIGFGVELAVVVERIHYHYWIMWIEHRTRFGRSHTSENLFIDSSLQQRCDSSFFNFHSFIIAWLCFQQVDSEILGPDTGTENNQKPTDHKKVAELLDHVSVGVELVFRLESWNQTVYYQLPEEVEDYYHHELVHHLHFEFDAIKERSNFIGSDKLVLFSEVGSSV